MNNIRILRTTNRKLENYLYMVGIKPIGLKNKWDGMVEWSYEDTPEFRKAHAAYRELVGANKKSA